MVVQNTCNKDIPEHDNDDVVDNHSDAGDRVAVQENATHSEMSDEEPEENDLIRLKEVIPSVCAKDNVTQLDIILEAIRYIDSLKNRLADRIENGEVDLVKVPIDSLKE